MNILVSERILHLIITNEKKCQNEMKTIREIASEYEGDIKNRIGFNFPFKNIKNITKNKLFQPYVFLVDYVIVYKKGDVLTKKHELLHAKYFMDESYRKDIKKLWNNLDTLFQKTVLEMLKKMNYGENMNLLMDEFQAYYFSEQANFFGKPKFK